MLTSAKEGKQSDPVFNNLLTALNSKHPREEEIIKMYDQIKTVAIIQSDYLKRLYLNMQ